MIWSFVFCLLCIIPSSLSCGIGGNHRIIGGVTSIPNNWPWQVSLQLRDFTSDFEGFEEHYTHMCGGSIVSPKYILTAAHCFVESFTQSHMAKKWKVVAGEHDLNKDSGREQTRTVVRIIRYPGYTRVPGPYDITLLELDAPLKYGRGVSPICLPEQDTEEDRYQRNCMLTGWGLTKDRRRDATRLQQVGGPIVDQATCRKTWKHYLLDSNLCFGNGLTGGCMGDSGGPLVCREGRRWFQLGVVSWGSNTCTKKGYPSVFTRTSKYVNWIKSVTENVSNEVTSGVTKNPTKAATHAATHAPTHAATHAATHAPTHAATNAPTRAVTHVPTVAPSQIPSQVATQARTHAPTHAPTNFATHAQTHAPTQASTQDPTDDATQAPTTNKESVSHVSHLISISDSLVQSLFN